MIRVTCTNGDVDDVFSVGVGMMAVALSLHTCRRCRAFRTLETNLTAEERQGVPACPSCGGGLVLLAEDQSEDLVELGECPKCSGTLTAETCGLWD